MLLGMSPLQNIIQEARLFFLTASSHTIGWYAHHHLEDAL